LNWTGDVYSSAASHPQLSEGARVQIPYRRTVQTAAARILVQSGRLISVLDPLTGALKPLTSFGPDWTNIGSTGMGCNLTHCVSIGAFGGGFGGFCIGIFEVAEPTHIRAVPLNVSAGLSAPAFVDAGGTHEWQVLDYSGNLYRIDHSLSLHKMASASSFSPPYYYHATPAASPLATHTTLWCALSSTSEAKGQVEGCFDASNMAVATRSLASAAGYDTNTADCGFCAALGRLVCAGYNTSEYGVVAFDAAQTPSMSTTLLGTDARTAGWNYGFGVSKFAVLGNDTFVMLAQPNLGVQRHAELFVTRWDPEIRKLSAVSRAVQPGLDDGNIAWAVFQGQV